MEFVDLTIRYIPVSTENVTSHLRDLDISTLKVGSEFTISDRTSQSSTKDDEVFRANISPRRSVNIYVYGITVSADKQNCVALICVYIY